MFSRGIRIIVLTSLVFILATNFAFFTSTQDYMVGSRWDSAFIFYHPHGDFEYRGFKYFYDYLSTFPGLANTFNTIQDIANILSMQIQYTGWTVLDYFIGIIQIIGSPVMILITFLTDVVNILIWLFTFFFPHAFS